MKMLTPRTIEGSKQGVHDIISLVWAPTLVRRGNIVINKMRCADPSPLQHHLFQAAELKLEEKQLHALLANTSSSQLEEKALHALHLRPSRYRTGFMVRAWMVPWS